MAGKKIKSEVESIRADMQQLTEAVWALREHVTVQSAAAAAEGARRGAGPPDGRAVANDLIAPDGDRGVVVTRGVVRSATGDREYRWDLEAPTSDLLAIDDDLAARLLAAIGHRQRIAILKAIIAQPTTAADLVSSLELGTTGAAYHHLNVLQAADLVTQETRGVFSIQPHRVSTIFAMFAGIESAVSISVLDSPDAAADGDTGGKRKRKSA
jgi:DNA gyrase subunit B